MAFNLGTTLGYGLPAAREGYSWMDQLLLQQKQAAIQAQLLKALATPQGQGQPPQGGIVPPAGGGYGPMRPGVAAPPGAVSPQVSGMAPAAGGAPADAGSLPPASPGGGGAPPQDIMSRLLPLIAQMKGDPRAITGAFGDTAKMFSPYERAQDMLYGRLLASQTSQANTDKRVDEQKYAHDAPSGTAKLNNVTRMQIAMKTGEIRTQIARLNRENNKLKDDPEYRALETIAKDAEQAYNASTIDDNLIAKNQAAMNLLTYAKSVKRDGVNKPAVASAPATDNNIQPGEPTATGADGSTLVVRNGQWVKANAAPAAP